MNHDSGININKFEFERKIFHIIVGIILATLIYYNYLEYYILLLILILGIAISYISRKKNIPIIEWFLMRFDRREHKNFPGRGVLSIFFAVTILLVLMHFNILSRNVVLASIMIWTFGDSLSAIVGTSYIGRLHPFNKTRYIEGTITGMIGGALTAWLFIPFIPAIIASVIAIGLESIELQLLKHPIDDNILVPLISALVITVVLFFI